MFQRRGYGRPAVASRREGGCGEVWEATQGTLARLIAIKKIRQNLFHSLKDSQDNLATIEQSFRHEAAAAAQLEHPNIVPIHDLWYDEYCR